VQLSEEQARQGAEVTVMTVEKGLEPWVRPSTSLVTSKCFPMTLPLRNPGLSVPFARELGRNIRHFDFVHIHAIWNFPTYYTMRSALAAGVPYMVAPQGSLEPWALTQNRWGKLVYGSLLEVPLLKRAACLQAVSSTEAHQIRDFGLEVPTFVIPNGVNAGLLGHNEVRSLAVKLGLSADRKTLLYLSRLHPKKGADILIQAFARIPATEPLTLVIAGSDAGSGFGESLKQLASDLGLKSRCIFLGEVKGKEKYDTLLGADFFALPSHSEGLPVAVIEAMASGLPVLITPGCNLPEVEKWEAGRVLMPEVHEFARGLLETVSDTDRAREMGLNGRRLVKAKFTWETIARETLGIYKTVLAGAA
jgi:glycosyltransferase involved in cell wall biosynthesis